MTSFIEIAQIFTGRATDIDDIITNIAGTLVGYLIAYWFTGIFTRKIVKNSKKNDFCFSFNHLFHLCYGK